MKNLCSSECQRNAGHLVVDLVMLGNYQSKFYVPKDPEMRGIWNRRIPGEDILTDKCFVCRTRHYDSRLNAHTAHI